MSSLTVDGGGNVYVEAIDTTVYKLTAAEVGYNVSVVYPSPGVYGEESFAGIVADDSDDLFVSDRTVSELVPSSSGYTAGPIIRNAGSTFIAIDGRDNLYFDVANRASAVRMTRTASGYVQTASLTGLDVSGNIAGIAVDGRGDPYISGAVGSSAERYMKIAKIDYADPPSLSFPSTAVGSSSVSKQVVVENFGNAPLSFAVPASGTNPAITGDFKLNSSGATACPLVEAGAAEPGTLAAGASCTLTVTFNPKTSGALTGTLVIADNELNSSAVHPAKQIIELSGGRNTVSLATASAPVKPVQYQPFTLTATVTGSSGGPIPTGTVTFAGLGSPAPVATLNASGQASWTPMSLSFAPGFYQITASYSGDKNYGPATEAVLPLEIDSPAVTTLKVTSGGNFSTTYGSGAEDTICVEAEDVTQHLLPGLVINWDQQQDGYYGTYFDPWVTTTDANGVSCNTPQLLGSGELSGTASTIGYPLPGEYPGDFSASGGLSTSFSAYVAPAVLTLQANNVDIQYGQVPSLSYSLTGFVNGDKASVVSGAPTLTTTATSTSPHGSYPITLGVGSLTAYNYTFKPSSHAAAVEVLKAPLTVTANTVTMTEGGTVPALTYTISGFVNGEDASVVSGTATLTTTATSSSTIGEYPITVNVSGLSAENYYFVPAVHGGVVNVSK
jgi:hypothetical protein